MPMAMPAITTEQCITPEQLENPESVLTQGSVPGRAPGTEPDTDCAISDYNLDGNTVTWAMEWTVPQAMRGEGEMTFGDDTYTGLMRMTTPQGEMAMNYAANRVGECAP